MDQVTLPRATVQQALEALDRNWDGCVNSPEGEAITALRAALEQPEPGSVCARCGGWVCDPVIPQPVQEPVADRSAFERHAESLGYSVDPDTREGREGGYWSSHTHLMWETWQAALEQPEQAEPVALWHRSGDGYAPVTLEQSHPPEPLTLDEALAQGWRRFYAHLPSRKPEQEPVAWMHVSATEPRNRHLEWTEDRKGYRGDWIKTPLVAAPAPRQASDAATPCRPGAPASPAGPGSA